MRWGTPSYGEPVEELDGPHSRWWLQTSSGSASSPHSLDRVGPVIDPDATAVWFGPDHERHRPDLWVLDQPWPAPRPQRWSSRPLVVYEAHVRGMTRALDRPDRGTFSALVDELPRLADLGVSVVELLPVHQFDPAERNYWGYMPVVFGAVHQQYATDPSRAADELADLISAAHEHDIEIWLDVVFNHTSEEDELGPLHHLRALGAHPTPAPGEPWRHDFYVLDDQGRLANEAGTGNTIDTHQPRVQQLIMTALDRFADLGVDGFRFDLATIVSRNADFARAIGDWGEARGVRLVAEAWDIVRYHVGQAWPDQRWMQWNGPFRDDVRSFLRGEPGMVWAVMRRIAGSPDLFDDADRSVNFITAHDGFTMYDLVAYDRKHNATNGHDGADGTDDNRSWNCGHEGDDDVPGDVMQLRRRQLRNAACLLLLSAGVPMFVAGDEFARTQQGNNNAYNQDNEISWINWNRREEWVDHEEFVADLIRFRSELDFTAIEFHGTTGEPDLAHHSRSIAWHLPESGVYVVANAWWGTLDVVVQAEGTWRIALDTTDPGARALADEVPTAPDGSSTKAGRIEGRVTSFEVGPRSVVVLASVEP